MPKLLVKFCGVDESCWHSKLCNTLGNLCGLNMNGVTHVALGVDLTDIGGYNNTYDLVTEGVRTSDVITFDDVVVEEFSLEYEPNDIEGIRYVREVVGRVTFVIDADLKLDVTDLLRVLLRRRVKNHTCVSLVRFLLGYERDDTIRTPLRLLKELKDGSIDNCGI